jgi:putative endonuclease
MLDPFFMWYVYVLYSECGGKTYVGYTNDVERRLFEHNVSESKGFTLRYRPWKVIHKEIYKTKPEAIIREKFYKTGLGREELKLIMSNYLSGHGAVSAAAEKD